MGEKAVTDKVINKLLFLLGDTNPDVRNSACAALNEMGEKAMTNKVIERLLDAYHHENYITEWDLTHTISRVLDLLPSLEDLKDKSRVQKLSMCVEKMSCWLLKNSSSEKFIRAFLSTEIEFWLSIIRRVLIVHKHGITVTKNTIIVYGSKEPIELTYSKRELGQRLKDCFVNWLDESLRDATLPCSSARKRQNDGVNSASASEYGARIYTARKRRVQKRKNEDETENEGVNNASGSEYGARVYTARKRRVRKRKNEDETENEGANNASTSEYGARIYTARKRRVRKCRSAESLSAQESVVE
jgi:hypothetical protein